MDDGSEAVWQRSMLADWSGLLMQNGRGIWSKASATSTPGQSRSRLLRSCCPAAQGNRLFFASGAAGPVLSRIFNLCRD
ncbi:MAG: hypothetical protein LBP22_17020 [Deltaproteobacteria bacterium]|nr:hypothetical protein [Deltaproteobacteria bacterium]